MSLYLYPQSCADFYDKRFDEQEYLNQINVLKNINDTWIGVNENGFYVLNLIQKIIQVVKGFFGFDDQSNVTLITSELLKLLHYGVNHGYIQDKNIDDFKLKINQYKKLSNSVRKVVSQLNSEISTNQNLVNLRETLLSYHSEHRAELEPSFWQKQFTSPSIPSNLLRSFGDVYLNLIDLAIEIKPNAEPDVNKAYLYIEKAKVLNGVNSDFILALVAKVRKVLDTDYSSYHFSLTDNAKRSAQLVLLDQCEKLTELKTPIKDVFTHFEYALKLFKTDQVCKTNFEKKSLQFCLKNQQTAILVPYLNSWAEKYPSDTSTLANIADVYWLNRAKTSWFDDGSRKERAIKIYEKICSNSAPSQKNSISSSALVKMHFLLGDNAFENATSFKMACEHIKKAIEYSPNDPLLRKKAYDLFIQMAEKEYKKGIFNLLNPYSKENHMLLCREAYNLYPEAHSENVNTLVKLYLSQKSPSEEALSFYQSVKLHSLANKLPLTAKQFHQIGNSLLSSEDKESALSFFKQAVELHSNGELYPSSFLSLAQELYQDKLQSLMTCKSLDEANQVESITNNFFNDVKGFSSIYCAKTNAACIKAIVQSYDLCLELYINKKEVALSRALYEKITDNLSDHITMHNPIFFGKIYFQLALHHCRQSEKTHYEKCLERALKLNPNNPYYHTMLGFQKGNDRKYLISTMNCFTTNSSYNNWFSNDFELWYKECGYFWENLGAEPLPPKI